MQINRLFEIIYMLLNKDVVTARELAERFEVSVRTIYRDVENLSQAGIPVYMSKGKGGGIKLLPGYVLNKAVLSEQEKSEILSALQGLNAVNSATAGSAFSKLSSIFGMKYSNWIEVDYSDWSNMKQTQFSHIKQAILNKNVISFDYYSSYGEKTSRRVEPILLWFKSRTWYLKAFCLAKQDSRIFKLNRIKNLCVTDSTFEEREPVERDDSFFTMPYCIRLVLKIHKSQAFRVFDDYDEEQVETTAEGDFLAISYMPEDDWVYNYILSYGAYAEVIEPLHVREIIKSRLQKVLNIYL